MTMTEGLCDPGEGGAARRHLAGLLLFEARYFLSGPDEELHRILADRGWWASLEEAGVVGSHPGGEPTDLGQHRRRFQELFKIPGDRFVPPFEQAYRGEEATVDSAAPTECARLYRAAGYQTAPYAGVQADHIGHQLRFVAALLEREAQCLDRGEEAAAQRVRSWWSGFLAEHCRWWPEFAAAVSARKPPREVAAAASLAAGLYESLRHGSNTG